jgi:PAB-dependent poly(A)-specific ribonuclease subunit 2
LDKMAQDWRSIPPHTATVDHVGKILSLEYNHLIVQVLATAATTAIRCMNCRSEHTRPGTTFVNELLYPLPVSYMTISCTKS